MSEKQDIWMPLYIGDYLRDTSRLKTEQHGAYLLIIMDYWTNGPPPDDDEVLACITKMQLPIWRKTRPVLAKLFKIEAGEWRHKRIDEELEKAAFNAEKYAIRARKAAEKRWNNDATSNASSNATSISSSNALVDAQGMLEECTSPSPSSIKPSISDALPTIQKTDIDIPAKMNGYGSIAVELIKLGVKVSSIHPTLQAWVDEGFTLEKMLEAVAIARQSKPEPENIPANYLDRILRDKPKEQKTREPPWWSSEKGILAKGNELGMKPRAGEDWAQFKQRINEKLSEKEGK